MADKLAKYNEMRRFDVTPEPSGEVTPGADTPMFVVQKHDATRLHYDFRLEFDGVLWSWAVPQGPCYDPDVKRLAVHTEDHPVAYGDFEGVIPKGQYGAGTVIVWDRGTWTAREDARTGLAKGHLTFDLHGERLHGHWHLVRIANDSDDGDNWLLFKGKDGLASKEVDVVAMFDSSVLSGRTLADVAAEPWRVWRSGKGVVGPVDPTDEPGAVLAELPRTVEPQLAKSADRPPAGDDWLHEIKYDGYRVQIRMDGDEVRLYTRKGLDWTPKWGRIAEAAAVLPANSALLDGEVVVMRDDGATDFNLLQKALSEGDQSAMRYLAFDLVFCEGYDLRGLPLSRRKELLQRLLDAAPPQAGILRYTDHVLGSGPLFFDQISALGLEGIVSKRVAGTYRSGRSDGWRKIKTQLRQEFVVVGFTEVEGGGTGMGALVLAGWEGGRLLPVGRVGTGFSDAQRDEFFRALQTIEVDQPEVVIADDDPDDNRGVHWVRPLMVVEVGFTGWTGIDRVRHAVFAGVRQDKAPADVARKPEAAAAMARVTELDERARQALSRIKITTPHRVLWPDVGVTKAELLAYWAAVADHALPELAGRPLSIVRCPHGIKGQCFYQKHAEKGVPDWVKHVTIVTEAPEPFLWLDSLEGLLSLAQLNTLEFHPWGARVADPDHPDRIIFDLDPAEDAPWGRVAEAAFHLRDLLADLGFASFPRTTGGKGLHVVVPVRPEREWGVARAFARGVAQKLVQRHRNRLTLSHVKEARRGRLYVDILRNAKGATAVGSWSTRARPGATIAVPVRWDEVVAMGGGGRFNVRNVYARLAGLRTPSWEGFDEAAVGIGDDVLQQVGVTLDE